MPCCCWKQPARTFAEDGCHADAMVVELHLTSCLLHLRQFAAVLNKCQGLRSHFTATGQQPELGQTLLNGVMAYAGLHQFEHALGLLAEVRAIFTPATSLVWYTMAELERAAILFHRALQATDETDRRAELAASLAISETCIPIFV